MPKRKTPQGYWPAFDSAFLSEIVSRIKNRSKSLKHSVETFSCERVREKTEGVEYEKLEMTFQPWGGGPRPVQITFYCWDDRWLWLDVRQSAKSGWVFEWQHQGRVGKAGPRAIASLLLQSVRLLYGEDLDSALQFLNEKWQAVAISGPKELQ